MADKINIAKPFQANCCLMPSPVPTREAKIYQRIRDVMVKAHCADKRPAHKCAGMISLTAKTITLQCPRCGDLRKTLG